MTRPDMGRSIAGEAITSFRDTVALSRVALRQALMRLIYHGNNCHSRSRDREATIAVLGRSSNSPLYKLAGHQVLVSISMVHSVDRYDPAHKFLVVCIERPENSILITHSPGSGHSMSPAGIGPAAAGTINNLSDRVVCTGLYSYCICVSPHGYLVLASLVLGLRLTWDTALARPRLCV